MCCCLSVAIAAQPYVNVEQRFTAEQLHATGLDTLTPAQLEQLNKLLRGESVEAAKSEPAHEQGEPGHGWNMGLDEQPIKSRVKGTVNGWEPGTVFELENGQQWKVLKGSMKLKQPMEAPEVEVVPGFAGRWFLHVSEDLPGARVYRID
jgi:hypothetical protein